MQLHTFVASAIHTGALSTSRPGLFTSIRKGGCMDLRVGVDAGGREGEKVLFDPVAKRTPVA